MKFHTFFYVFTGNNERCLHLLHGFAAMSLINATVVSGNNKDSLF